MTKYVAICCRISKDKNGRTEGVRAQERWGRAYAAEHWPNLPVEVFSDGNASAMKEPPIRPEHDRFCQWLADGKIAQVWAVEQSRVERDEIRWFKLAAEMDAVGVEELHTNRDGIVRVRDEVAGIKAVLNAGEVRKLRKRVNETLADRAAEGRPSGGRTFGYERYRDSEDRAALRIIPEQAAILQGAADKILAGWSLSSVAANLTEQGVRGANGAVINYGTLRRMLTNPTVAGYRVYRKEIVGKGKWEPILDENTWQSLRAKLSKPRTVRTEHGADYDITEHQYSSKTRRRYLLTGGVAVCGVCETPMRAQRRKVHGDRLAAVYTCWHGFHVGIMADEFERFVSEGLLAELDKPEFLAALSADDLSEQRGAILAALSAAEAQRVELAALWATPGELTAAEWRAARQGIDQREQQLLRQLSDLPQPIVDVDFSQVREAWPAMNLHEQREIVELFIARVLVRPAKPGIRRVDAERVLIEWRAAGR